MTPPSGLQQADQYFENGDYPNAVEAYSSYLREQPEGRERDRALYRLGLAYALPANPSQDANQALAYLNQLATEYPKSPLRPEAELISSMEQQIQNLHAEIAQRQQQLDEMHRQMEGLKQEQSGMEQLKSDLKDREDRIHQLTGELEKLKAIDLQRRPTTPPKR